ncbi:MAG: DUF1428 domain-containing protein [Planctomycetes bacterium]|nr:DUF1428 domain-containing protein [Planctomycetota bacterium]
MARYVDGFLLAVPKKNLAAYKRMARLGSKVWCDHGALAYCECAADDLTVKCGVPFPKVLRLKPTETVVFAWIVYRSRKERDRINAKVMADPRLAKWMQMSMPFDMNRMSSGGFQVLVEA